MFYGITKGGGPGYPAADNGVLYKLAPNGTYTVLHAFTAGSDGGQPLSLLLSSSGTLVGSAGIGGIKSSRYCPYGCGLDYTYTPKTAKFSVVHDFTGQSGYAGFVGSIGPGPTLYGDDGYALYSLSTGGGFANIDLFYAVIGTGINSGPLLTPNGKLIGVKGASPTTFGSLYTASGGIVTVLTFFDGASNGAYPLAQPILSPTGTILGTTTARGLCTTCGTIWQYNP